MATRVALVVSLFAPGPSARAQDARSFSGDYVCQYGCRVTDAAPGIAIVGKDAACTNELGGIFHGTLLSSRLISCFNKIGTLSADGKTIHWTDGVVWKRHE